MSSRPVVITAVVAGDAQEHEDTHVHQVYDQIASHFASTRYKPWPLIARFLSSLPTGWVGLDSGTGNGKYLSCTQDRPPGSLWTIGLDRSRNLLEIARQPNHSDTIREVVLGDVLGCGWRDGAFDFAISIATVHHLSTLDRRQMAIQRLLQCVSPVHGRILIYVWAIEQDGLSRREIPHGPGLAGAGQDVFVPWVLSERTGKGKNDFGGLAAPSANRSTVYHRYYHMFAVGELVSLVRSAADRMGLEVLPPPEESSGTRLGVEIFQEGWERSNYYVELRRWMR